jgi:hypothetical protein
VILLAAFAFAVVLAALSWRRIELMRLSATLSRGSPAQKGAALIRLREMGRAAVPVLCEHLDDRTPALDLKDPYGGGELAGYNGPVRVQAARVLGSILGEGAAPTEWRTAVPQTAAAHEEMLVLKWKRWWKEHRSEFGR